MLAGREALARWSFHAAVREHVAGLAPWIYAFAASSGAVDLAKICPVLEEGLRADHWAPDELILVRLGIGGRATGAGGAAPSEPCASSRIGMTEWFRQAPLRVANADGACGRLGTAQGLRHPPRPSASFAAPLDAGATARSFTSRFLGVEGLQLADEAA